MPKLISAATASKTPELFKGVDTIVRPLSKAVVTIGNFDGVHLGHRHIIALAREKARALGGKTIAFTFRPHPQIALRPEAALPLLTTYDEKLELLGKLGLDAIVEEPFSREFSTTSPEAFFNEAILSKLSAVSVVVGYDFAFGKGRQGNLDALGEWCARAGVELTVVEPRRFGGEIVSSSRIRGHLLAGEVDVAANLLGREFFYRGVVVKGEQRGRTIGFPTANLKLENKLALPNGVYATESVLYGADGAERRLMSVTNVGVRPTFFADENLLPAVVETYLIDQDIDLYGSTLEVRFKKRLRAEKRFSGIDALKDQIVSDVRDARRILGG